MDYLESLKTGWQITWKNKGLWLLGILAACSGAGDGGPDLNFRNSFSGNGNSRGGDPFDGSAERALAQMQQWLAQNGTLLITIIGVAVVVALLLGLLFLVLGFIARGGLLKGAQLAQVNGQVSFGEAFGAGREQMWRLFSIWLYTDFPFAVLGLCIAIAGLVVVFTILSQASSASTALASMAPLLFVFVPLICIIALARFVARILNHMGTLAAVLEGQRGLDALRTGFTALRENFIPFTVMAVILAVVQGIIGVALAFPLILAVVPVMLGVIAGIATGGDNSTAGSGALAGMGVALLCFVVYAPILWLAQGILQTWHYATWADTYQRLRGPAQPPAPAPAPTPDFASPMG